MYGYSCFSAIISFSLTIPMPPTSPGTNILKVLKVEELPEEIRDYFLNFEEDPSQ